jgi:hypothetical protein
MEKRKKEKKRKHKRRCVGWMDEWYNEMDGNKSSRWEETDQCYISM